MSERSTETFISVSSLNVRVHRQLHCISSARSTQHAVSRTETRATRKSGRGRAAGTVVGGDLERPILSLRSRLVGSRSKKLRITPRANVSSEQMSVVDGRETRRNSPLEKKDVLRPMHSVAGGEFGGAEDEEDAAVADRYLVPFQITNFPSTVSKDSRRVLCRLAPPKLLDESRFEHSPTASTSPEDDGRFTTVCACWLSPGDSCGRWCSCNCCLFRVFRRFFFFFRVPAFSSSLHTDAAVVDPFRLPSTSDFVVVRVTETLSASSQSFTFGRHTTALRYKFRDGGINDWSRTRRLARPMRFQRGSLCSSFLFSFSLSWSPLYLNVSHPSEQDIRGFHGEEFSPVGTVWGFRVWIVSFWKEPTPRRFVRIAVGFVAGSIMHSYIGYVTTLVYTIAPTTIRRDFNAYFAIRIKQEATSARCPFSRF